MKMMIRCLFFLLCMTTATVAQIQLPHWSMFRPGVSGADADFTGTPVLNAPSSLPVATDDAGNALQSYRSTNSWYDCGVLKFYVVSVAGRTYIYDAAGVKYTQLAFPALTYASVAGNEITILPVPNSCGNKFHVIVGGSILEINTYTRQILSITSFSPGLTLNGATKMEYPQAVKYTAQGYRIYYYYGTRTVNYKDVTFNSNGTFTVGGGYPYSTIGWTGFGPTGISIADVLSEVEISPNGNLFLINDDAYIRVYDLTSWGWNWSTAYNGLWPQNQRMAGAEFASNSTRIFYSVYDPTIPASDGIYYRDYPSGWAPVYVPGSAAFSHSQIELGRDGNLYMAKADGLWRLDNSTGATSSMTFTHVSATVTLTPNEGNSAGLTNSCIFTLPDQIDGALPANGVPGGCAPPVSGGITTINICEGQNAILNASGLPGLLGGGNGTYTWTPSTFLAGSGSTVTSTPSVTTTYTATFVNDFGCVAVKTFSVVVSPGPPPVHQNYPVCPNPGSLLLNANCGPGTTTEWYNNNILIGTGASYNVTNFSGSLDYTSVCKNASGCIVSRKIHHIILGSPPSQVTIPITICYGGSSIIPNPPCSGSGAYGTWQSAAGLTITPSSGIISTLSDRTYQYTCYDANGCPTRIYTYNVHVNPPAQTYNVIFTCYGNTVDLNGASGGSCNGTWTNDANQQSVPVSFTATASGSYTSSCVGNGGCITIRHVTVNVGMPHADEYRAAVICEGQAFDFDLAFSPYLSFNSCTWLDPAGNPVPMMILFHPTLSGLYTSQCTDAYGCTFQRALDLTITPAPVNSFGVQVCLGGTVDLSPNGGPGCSYSKIIAYNSNGQPVLQPVSPTFPANAVGTNFYRITCVDANGCLYHTDVAIDVPPAPVISLAAQVCEGDLVNLADYLDAGLTGCTFGRIIGYDVNGEPVLDPVTPVFNATTAVYNYYRVTCVDANGCIHHTEIMLDVRPQEYHNIEVTVPCGTDLDWSPYINPCTGGPDWAVDFGGGLLGYPPAGPLFHDLHMVGLSSDPCCHATLTIHVTPPVVTDIDLCVSGPFDVPLRFFNCDHGEEATWTHNGQPFDFQNVIWEAGEYEIICGCTITRLHVRFDQGCEYPGMLCLEWANHELRSNCPDGSMPHWYLNGQPYATGSSIVVSQEGIYTCKCLDAQGNVVSEKSYFVYSCNERLANPAENSEAESLKVFPNPNNGSFQLMIANFNGQPHTLEITDVLGRVVYRKENITTMPMQIDLSNEAKGMFTIRVFNGTQTYSTRIIAE